MIDEKEVTAYVTIPDCFLQGCSEDIVIFRADGGNHFTDYGIYEGMFLFFDRKKRFKKGRLLMNCDTKRNKSQKTRAMALRQKLDTQRSMTFMSFGRI